MIDRICRDALSGQLDPNAARVAIDAQKWIAGKENARKYGDRQQIEVGRVGEFDQMFDQELKTFIAAETKLIENGQSAE